MSFAPMSPSIGKDATDRSRPKRDRRQAGSPATWLTWARKVVELVPTAPGSYGTLAQMLLAAGQRDEALVEVEKESDLGFRAYALTRIYIVLG